MLNIQPLVGALIDKHGSIQAAANAAGVHANLIYGADKHYMRIDNFIKLSRAAGQSPSDMLERCLITEYTTIEYDTEVEAWN